MGDNELPAERPPANEVVLSVSMASQNVMTGPRIPEILGSWYDDHNRVQVVPQYIMPLEPPKDSSAQNGLSLPIFNVSAEPRYWRE
jgi:hypothetical protein